tara:strand:+ start:81 stop:404 length:324 start_codon:yes stop_codon:yes gene_type:complete
MKNYVFLLFPIFALGQQIELLPNLEAEIIKAEASCGICMFDMQGKSCELAVRFKGDSYYVEGAGIDDFGDAHAEEGFCNATRSADIQGEVIDNRFVLTYFKLKEEKE